MSFSENVVVTETSYQMLEEGEGLTSFNVDRSANVSVEKKYNESFQDVYFLRIRERNFWSTLVLIAVHVLESKVLTRKGTTFG